MVLFGVLFPEMGSAGYIAEGIIDVVKYAHKFLDKWVVVFECILLVCDHDIPSSKERNIQKLDKGGAAIGDNCNTLLKTKIFLVDGIRTTAVEMAKEKDIEIFLEDDYMMNIFWQFQMDHLSRNISLTFLEMSFSMMANARISFCNLINSSIQKGKKT